MTEVIAKFYEAFKQLDADTMLSYYDDSIIFKDPAFGTLKGERAKAMWRMLCNSQKGKDFKIEFYNVIENTSEASAHWEAFYLFSKTGRKVQNKIKANFKLKNGKIIEHTDEFNLHKWAGQALGLKGYLLGRTPFFKRKLQQQTNAMLDKYIENNK